jgi:hypothetical protein
MTRAAQRAAAADADGRISQPAVNGQLALAEDPTRTRDGRSLWRMFASSLECEGLPSLFKTRRVSSDVDSAVLESGGKPPHSKDFFLPSDYWLATATLGKMSVFVPCPRRDRLRLKVRKVLKYPEECRFESFAPIREIRSNRQTYPDLPRVAEKVPASA